jgi:hypothetical protein
VSWWKMPWTQQRASAHCRWWRSPCESV